VCVCVFVCVCVCVCVFVCVCVCVCVCVDFHAMYEMASSPIIFCVLSWEYFLCLPCACTSNSWVFKILNHMDETLTSNGLRLWNYRLTGSGSTRRTTYTAACDAQSRSFRLVSALSCVCAYCMALHLVIYVPHPEAILASQNHIS
jgi:hypothetical protein